MSSDHATACAGPGPAARVHYAIPVLALIVLTVFAALGLARFGYTSILPAMQEGLGLSNAQTGELQSWNLLGYMLTVVGAGVLATRFGPRWVIACGLLTAGAGMVLTGAIPSLGGARAGRFLSGVGGAAANVPAMALISAWFGARRRGVAAGAGVAGSSVALVVCGPMIPAILERSGTGGWRICWYVLGSMAIASAVLCLAWLRNRPEEMGIAPLGETDLERQARNVGRSSGQRSLGPLFRSAVLWHLAGVYFAFGFSYIIYSTFFIRHLTGEGGLTAGEAGLIWLRVGLISVASGFVWGAFSDRWGRRKALLCVFAIQSISFLAMGLGRCGAWVEVSAGLFAVSAWSVPALMAALAGDMFGARLAPAALGLLTIVFGLGQTTGPYVAGRMADTLHSLAPAFVLAGLVALILGMGGTLALALHREST